MHHILFFVTTGVSDEVRLFDVEKSKWIMDERLCSKLPAQEGFQGPSIGSEPLDNEVFRGGNDGIADLEEEQTEERDGGVDGLENAGNSSIEGLEYAEIPGQENERIQRNSSISGLSNEEIHDQRRDVNSNNMVCGFRSHEAIPIPKENANGIFVVCVGGFIDDKQTTHPKDATVFEVTYQHQTLQRTPSQGRSNCSTINGGEPPSMVSDSPLNPTSQNQHVDTEVILQV